MSEMKSPTATTSEVPVGSIIACAAAQPFALDKEGWLVCDGRVLDQEEFSDLFAVIGIIHGAEDSSTFCLPDLQGRFVRGVASGQPIDPDANSRTVPRPDLAPGQQGNSGDRVGSTQACATGVARTPFVVTMRGLPDGTHNGLSPDGANTDFAVSNPPSTDVPTTDGGDSESRPPNKAVAFLIKATVDAVTPAGGAIAYAGTDITAAQGFRLCDGSNIDATNPANKALWDALKTAHGGDGNPFFYLPDFRGLFLRGNGGNSTVNPDAQRRTVARPDLPAGQQGNSGSRIGSAEGSATALPKEPFISSLAYLPDDGVHVYNSVGTSSGRTNWDGNTVPVSRPPGNNGGGDSESRPVNTAVDWLLQTDPGTTFPVGTVIAFGGENPLSGNWRPCHGGFLATQQFPALYEAIGTTYGSDPNLGFRLPDYRGYFLRGRNRGTSNDPDMPNRSIGTTEQYATAVPNNPFVTHVPRLPVDSNEELNAAGHEHKVSNWTDDRLTQTNTGGGDAETRPTNIALDFIIRVA